MMVQMFECQMVGCSSLGNSERTVTDIDLLQILFSIACHIAGRVDKSYFDCLKIIAG